MSAITSLQHVHVRLSDAVRYWFQALHAYASPDVFRLHVNACITTLRQVTFILQSNKRDIPFFDEWYEGETGWRSRFQNDETMKWAVDARNTIEKRGDLETHSQLRVTVIANWLNVTEVDFDVCPFVPTEQIILEIDKSSIPSEVCEHGLLRAERRWVATSLPNCELLDAMSHVAGVLTLMVLDGFALAGQSLDELKLRSPDGAIVSGTRLLSLGGKFPQMRVTLPDRTSWLKLSTGELIDFERTSIDLTRGQLKKEVEGRYDFAAPNVETCSGDISQLEQEGTGWFIRARTIFEKDKFHCPIFILQGLVGPPQIVGAPIADRSEKYAMFRHIASEVKRSGADRVFVINEMWTATAKQGVDVVPAEFHVDRGEVLALFAVNSRGECFQFSAEIKRIDGEIHLGPTIIERPETPPFLGPIREVWNSDARAGA